MKKFILVTGLILAWSTVLPAGDGNQYALSVHGLACPFCAYGIEKRLSAIEGVEKVEIDIAKGQATVIMQEDSILSEKEARQAVKEAGFALGSFAPLVGK